MQKIILFILCCCVGIGLFAQPNVNKAEYFFNTDPGFGNAVNIPVTPAQNISDVGFSANITSLPVGINQLYIRTRDANNRWSVTNRYMFVKTAIAIAPPNLSKAEYFFDNDPGFDKATAVTLSPSTDIQNQALQVAVNALQEGLHNFFLRTKDANGKWSLTNRALLVKLADSVSLTTDKAEYFIDTDPGFGNGINIPLTAAKNIDNISLSVPVDTVKEGMHQFFVRSRNNQGKWSITNRFMFVKVAALANITQVEYFIDTDPGIGNAVPVAINATTNLADYITQVNVTGLATGAHKLYIRSRNANGKWSITNIINFPLATQTNAPAIVVNSITDKDMCGGDIVRLSYHATGAYNTGNVFTAQLSNASGSFASPVTIGTFTGTVSAIINCKLPRHIADGTGYRVRVVSSNPVVTGLNSDNAVVLHNRPEIGSDTTVLITCSGEQVNLTNIFTTNGYTLDWNTATPTSVDTGTYRLIATNTSGCKDTVTAIVKQEVATWKGTVSKDWSNPANWSTGKVPSEKTHVIIPAGTPNICELSNSDAQVASMQIKQGAKISVINNRKALIKSNCNPLPE